VGKTDSREEIASTELPARMKGLITIRIEGDRGIPHVVRYNLVFGHCVQLRDVVQQQRHTVSGQKPSDVRRIAQNALEEFDDLITPHGLGVLRVGQPHLIGNTQMQFRQSNDECARQRTDALAFKIDWTLGKHRLNANYQVRHHLHVFEHQRISIKHERHGA